MSSKIALAVAIALAILTAVGIRAYLREKEEKFTETRKLVPVLVAAKDIKRGTRLSSDMIREEEVGESEVQDGRTLLPWHLDSILTKPILADVRAGERLLWSQFIEESRIENPAAGMPPGYRQITIPVDKVTGCAGRLLPGTIVDILVTFRVRRDPNAPIEPVTQTVLTGMEVVATDLNVRRVYAFLSARERRDYAAYSTVTLRALPIQANLLAFLADQGKVHLVIRSADDPTGQAPAKIDKVSFDNLDAIIKKAAEEKPPQ